MRRFRILHVIGSLDPRGGGPPVIAASLAEAQSALGHEVQIASYGQASKSGPDCLEQRPGGQQVAAHFLAPPNRMESLLALGARKQLAPLIAECDLVHIHGVWDAILVAAARAARDAKKPYVVLLNGMLDPWCMTQGRIKKHLALTLFHRRMLDNAAFLHCGNLDEERLLAPLNLRAPKAIIPNGIDLNEVDPLPAAGAFFAEYPVLGGRPFLLFMGRLHVKKGLDLLAEAFPVVAERHPELQLVVAGPDDGARADFERRIAGLSVRDRIHLIGPVNGRFKWAALRDTACFCLPSRQEGFSMAILEALASRTPVVITEGCHFPEVKDAGAGEVVPIDASAVAQALLRVLDDSMARDSMGAAGRKLVEDRFTWRRAAERSIEVYGQFIP